MRPPKNRRRKPPVLGYPDGFEYEDLVLAYAKYKNTDRVSASRTIKQHALKILESYE